MNKEQAIHVGMINSYNIITDKASFEQIASTGLGVFAHQPDEELEYENLKFIILYFQTLEMFEHCAELKWYMNENFNEDGSYKEDDCECSYPDIREYNQKVKCHTCKKRIRR